MIPRLLALSAAGALSLGALSSLGFAPVPRDGDCRSVCRGHKKKPAPEIRFNMFF